MQDQLVGAATDLVDGVDQPAAEADLLGDSLRLEACTLMERAANDDRQQRWQAAVLTGDLLDRARRALAVKEMEPSTFARVLRSSVLIRDMAAVPDLPADPVLDELITHTTEHGLASHNAAAQALRGNLAEARGDLDEAMDAAVNAMVTVELINEPSLERVFASNDIATLLLRLGLVRTAAQCYGNAATDAEAAGLRREYIITLGNQVASELLYAMALERTPEPQRAERHFAIAVELAKQGVRYWQQMQPERMREDHAAGFRAALAVDGLQVASDALSSPAPQSSPESSESPKSPKSPESPRSLPGSPDAGAAAEELEAQLRIHLASNDPECRLLPGIMLARRLAATGRREEARDLLGELAEWPRLYQAQPQLRVAVIRHLCAVDDPGPMPRYVTALENELWSQWVSRGRDLRARLERERLRRKHGPIRALAAEDPLTGLPNRRALDELLADQASADAPGAVAMVDLDELRVVNFRGSHADGDATLRAVAVAMRATLPATDSVIRYGGDEFVVLLPGDDVDTAAEKVERVVAAIAALPADRGHGVTASAGLVAVAPDESADSILVRADDAMSQAKQDGGNRVQIA